MRVKCIQKLVDKVRGKEKAIKCKNLYSREAFSQDGEDLVLHSFVFDDVPYDYKGFYVDIGAHHPERFSNTNIFYKMGWSGINIDGTPNSMVAFNKQRIRDINIEAVISNENSEVTYYLFDEPALNSFDKTLTKKYVNAGRKLREQIKVKTQKINDILEENLPAGQKIDFINIDIEGVDYEVICSLDYKKYAPKYFIIEDADYKEQDFMNFKDNSPIYKFLSAKNYVVVGKTRRSIIFKREK